MYLLCLVEPRCTLHVSRCKFMLRVESLNYIFYTDYEVVIDYFRCRWQIGESTVLLFVRAFRLFSSPQLYSAISFIPYWVCCLRVDGVRPYIYVSFYQRFIDVHFWVFNIFSLCGRAVMFQSSTDPITYRKKSVFIQQKFSYIHKFNICYHRHI